MRSGSVSKLSLAVRPRIEHKSRVKSNYFSRSSERWARKNQWSSAPPAYRARILIDIRLYRNTIDPIQINVPREQLSLFIIYLPNLFALAWERNAPRISSATGCREITSAAYLTKSETRLACKFNRKLLKLP